MSIAWGRRVVPGETRFREGAGQRKESHAAAAADVDDVDAGVQPFLHAVERRNDPRHEGLPGPGAEHPLGAVRCAGSELLVGQSDARPERLRQSVDHVVVGRIAERAAGEGHGVLLVREHRGGDAVEFEARLAAVLDAVVLEQSRGRLAVQPLPQPALLETARFGQLRRAHRAQALQRAVDAQTVAEVNHQGNELALLELPDLQGEGADLFRIEPSVE